MSRAQPGPGSGHLPFSSVVGQEDAKLALFLCAVEPRLGGVLLRGDKGSAKTTLARGLASILPGDAPFVELPLGAGEDRVLGSIDLAALLDARTHAFRPGLLAAAHGGVLYVDEINLLADHLVDSLLDVAASGVNRVERDGFSETHPARFVLVGSMNPEEGELRPQLLDRFGLAVEVRAPEDPGIRAEVVRRQLALDSSGPADESADVDLRERLSRSAPAPCAPETVDAASRLAVAVGAEGLRADLSLCRAAGALAGWEGRDRALPDDLRRVAPLVLGHRRRRRPFEAPGIASEELSAAVDEAIGTQPPPPPVGPDDQGGGTPIEEDDDRGTSGDGADDRNPASTTATDTGAQGDDRSRSGPGLDHGDPGSAPEGPPGQGPAGSDRGGSDRGGSVPDPGNPTVPDMSLPVDLPAPTPPRRASTLRGTGRQGISTAGASRGRAIGHEPLTQSGQRLDPAATTVRHAIRSGGDGDIERGDLRAVVARVEQPRLIVVAVDASGSMAGRRRLEAARSAVLALLGDAYRRRDRVAMVVFRGETAETVLRPTGSIEIARSRLADLPSGGRTPLAAGLAEVTRLIRSSAAGGGPNPVAVIITDGRATAGGPDPVQAFQTAAADLASTGTPCLVIDAETGPVRLGLAKALASTLSADHVSLEDLEAGGGDHALADAIRSRVGAA